MALSDWAGAIGGAVEGIFGIGRAKKNREHDKQMQQKQFENQQKLNEQGYSLSKRMWDATGYEAQKKQLEKAGLNPGLLYGMGGTGGATTHAGSGGSASAGSSTPSDAGKGMGMLLQQGLLMKAQKENIEADTEVKKADAENKKGVERTETETRTKDLLQGIENKKAQEALTRAQETLSQINIYEQNRSQDDRMDHIQWGAEKAYQDFITATNEAYIGVNTRDEKIRIIEEEALGAVLNNLFKEKQIEATEAQINKMAEDIAQGWQGLDNQEKSIAVQKFKEEINANYPNIMQVIGRGVDDTIETIFGIGRKSRKQHKGVK